MWYKFENGEWLIGNRIEFPDGFILHENHEESRDGWEWHENPPQEYLEIIMQ